MTSDKDFPAEAGSNESLQWFHHYMKAYHYPIPPYFYHKRTLLQFPGVTSASLPPYAEIQGTPVLDLKYALPHSGNRSVSQKQSLR